MISTIKLLFILYIPESNVEATIYSDDARSEYKVKEDISDNTDFITIAKITISAFSRFIFV